MGMLSLNRLLVKEERRSRRRIQARNGSITLVRQKKVSLWQEVDHSQSGENSTCSGPNLPEDIWCHIHSLMPLCDSARSACVSTTFLRSWRCHPTLIFNKETLGLKEKSIARTFTSTVDRILKNHSSAGVKILKLIIHDNYNVNACHLNSWLQNAVTPGIEEVTLLLAKRYGAEKYNFPCSIFLDGRGNSIRHLRLSCCILRPTAGFDCLRSLRKLCLGEVCITGDELGCIISNSFALEELELRCCRELTCLTIPFCLERFNYLSVTACNRLQVIESKAPNLSTIRFFGEPVQLVLGKSSHVKNLRLEYLFKPNAVSYAITKLPLIAPHLESLSIYSTCERVNTPIVADKFLHLKHLDIYFDDDDDDDDDEGVSLVYDYLSLGSFLYACPVLESFILSVDQDDMKHDSVFGDVFPLRQLPRHSHDRLKKVQVNGFCSAKSMFELTCHILENATSLENLTLDCILGEEVGSGSDTVRCSASIFGKCRPRSKSMVVEAHKALSVIKRYIVGRVPHTVMLNVGEPCSRCHAINVELL